jgi:hypothetical protein
LTELQNVQAFEKRQELKTKDISEGRWKVIRKELRKRGLPEVRHQVIKERDLPTDLKIKGQDFADWAKGRRFSRP